MSLQEAPIAGYHMLLATHKNKLYCHGGLPECPKKHYENI